MPFSFDYPHDVTGQTMQIIAGSRAACESIANVLHETEAKYTADVTRETDDGRFSKRLQFDDRTSFIIACHVCSSYRILLLSEAREGRVTA